MILHEMAHMWFGNLVTMQWWNGLWLNESFATFMATLALVEATEFSEGGLGAYLSTVRAYQADERDTTHPIELPTPDTDAAFANFDAITYNKGSAALTQLNHLVGPEAFRQGVSAYLSDACLREHDESTTSWPRYRRPRAWNSKAGRATGCTSRAPTPSRSTSTARMERSPACPSCSP
ncbi:MAG: M1 family aminopeptidase [Gammaproteobacteria bacterium]|nr:M1 family aminopeptidase [Gammaproteobacteria bacterium]